MPRIQYNKLIRDRIPEIIAQSGQRFAVTELSAADYETALRRKLVEEAQEAQHADAAELTTELADMLEVLDALLDVHGIDRAEVLALQQQRRRDRGGFAKRLCLLWTE